MKWRIWVQLLAAIGQNSWFPGYLSGRLYSGNLKSLRPGAELLVLSWGSGSMPLSGVSRSGLLGLIFLGLLPLGF